MGRTRSPSGMPSWRWAATCGESPRKEVKGARSGSSLFEEASSTKPETASSIYSASSRLDGAVDKTAISFQLSPPTTVQARMGGASRERSTYGQLCSLVGSPVPTSEHPFPSQTFSRRLKLVAFSRLPAERFRHGI